MSDTSVTSDTHMSIEADQVTAPDFIENRLLPGIKAMIDQGFDYLAFPLIAQTIELIGAFYDSTPFDEDEKNRFQNGIKHLFKNQVYKQNQTDLYENIRCFFAHQMRPGSGYLLTSLRNGVPKELHLKKAATGDRLLIVECFYEDLKLAVTRLMNDIRKELDGIDKKKVTETFLVVKQTQITASGTTATFQTSSFNV